MAATSRPKLGIALVGLGDYSEKELAPALQKTKLCYLAGIVTGTPEKAKRWAERYRLPDRNVYSYDTFDRIAENEEIQIIYVVLPTALHAEYTIRAAKAGKHVICEKPMAASSEECEAMIEACRAADKRLSIGYRLHFDPYHLELMRIGQEQRYGRILRIHTDNCGTMRDPKHWRAIKRLSGGGPLTDMGVYCIQASIYITGEEPISISAVAEHGGTLPEVEEAISWTMAFPSGARAKCRTSYLEDQNSIVVQAEKGEFSLKPAYNYRHLSGRTPSGPLDFGDPPQQTNQMDHFARCIIENLQTPVPGEMGMRDLKIIEAIYRAADSGKPVTLELTGIVDRPAPQELNVRLGT